MPSKPESNSVPPIEPTPAVAPPVPVVPPVPPTAAVPPPPPAPPVAPPVDPYAASQPSAPAQPYGPPQPYGQPPQPGQPYAPAYPGAVYYPQPGPPRGLAIASLVTGIAGAFFALFYGFGLFPAIAAIITGHLAQKRQPQAKGFWLAGLICGYVGLGISLLWIVAIIVFVALLSSSGGFDSTNTFGGVGA